MPYDHPNPHNGTEHVVQSAPIMIRTLHGRAASPGRYTGTVRVIHSEAEFDRLHAGDVLVCRVFLPVWTVLLPVSVRWSPTPAESCPTRQSSPANAASPQLLLLAWAQHCCGTANWSLSTGRAGLWRSSNECAVGHRSAASRFPLCGIDDLRPRHSPSLASSTSWHSVHRTPVQTACGSDPSMTALLLITLIGLGVCRRGRIQPLHLAADVLPIVTRADRRRSQLPNVVYAMARGGRGGHGRRRV